MAVLPGRATTYKERVAKTGDGISPIGQFANDASTIQRTYDVPWANRNEAIRDFLGGPFINFGSSGKKYIHRQEPHHDPSILTQTGKPFLYATKITNVIGIGTPDRSGAWEAVNLKDGDDVTLFKFARITVQYETLYYDIVSDLDTPTDEFGNPDEGSLARYVTIIPKPSAIYLTLPVNTFYYVPNEFTGYPAAGTTVNSGPGKIVPDHDLSITWHEVPKEAVASRLVNHTMDLDKAWIDKSMGKVNCTTFCGKVAGFVLLIAVDPKPVRSAFGERIYDVEFRFKVSQLAPHNYILTNIGSPEEPYWGWAEISIDGEHHPEEGDPAGTPTDGKHIYDSADFAKMFRHPN